MPNPNQEHDDFVQRFHNTWVRVEFPKEGRVAVTSIRDVKASPNGNYTVGFNAHWLPNYQAGMMFFATRDEFKILESLPSSKYINCNTGKQEGGKWLSKSAAYFSRVPERQYKRACCPNTYTWYLMCSTEIAMLRGVVRDFGYMIDIGDEWASGEYRAGGNGWGQTEVEQLFDPMYPTFTEAAHLLLNGEHGFSCAFSQYYCLALSFRHNALDLCRKNIPIARVTPQGNGQFMIQTEYDLFRQEILDLMRRGPITNSILV